MVGEKSSKKITKKGGCPKSNGQSDSGRRFSEAFLRPKTAKSVLLVL